MIFVSSACSRQKKIGPAVKELAAWGFKNIELTGGTLYYEGFESELLALKAKHGLRFLVHNYFPPPQIPFVLNLASTNMTIYQQTLAHLRKGLELTRIFGGNRFGFHAGFFFDPLVDEIGKKYSKSELYDKKAALKKFVDGFNALRDEFDDVALYVENHCYSESNGRTYGSDVPFMLLNFDDYQALRREIDFKLLFDVGHLMVSAGTCGFDFKRDFKRMFESSDYIHISNNDARHDQNKGLDCESALSERLAEQDWRNKIVTLEVYEGVDQLKQTYSIISKIMQRRIS